MQFRYVCMPDWPPLAWIAIVDDGCDFTLVKHGSLVEANEHWFGELVWDGPYTNAGFHQTDIVFGSGGRLQDGGIVFVASASTHNRLHHLRIDGRALVSNSLPCLLAEADANVDPHDGGYFNDFRSIIFGLNNYVRTIRTTRGDVELTYHDNLQLKDGGLARIAKPRPHRDFGTYSAYRDFLQESICRMADNLRAPQRRHSFDLLATVSTGFDSPTVAALARPAGLRDALCFDKARGDADDNGAEIARRLGLTPHVVPRDAWRQRDLAEAPFLAADAKGEDVYFAGAEPLLARRLLLTGFGATRTWQAADTPNDDFRRSDQSGLSLTEYRLWAGFLHCPVAAIGGRQTSEMYAMLRAAEMQPWQVNGNNKVFCRRVLAEAGVPDELYGQTKKAASVLLYQRDSFLCESSRNDFNRWRAGLPSPSAARRFGKVASTLIDLPSRGVLCATQQLALSLSQVVPAIVLKRVANSSRLHERINRAPQFDYLFPWAMEHAKQRYSASSTSTIDVETIAKVFG